MYYTKYIEETLRLKQLYLKRRKDADTQMAARCLHLSQHGTTLIPVYHEKLHMHIIIPKATTKKTTQRHVFLKSYK